MPKKIGRRRVPDDAKHQGVTTRKRKSEGLTKHFTKELPIHPLMVDHVVDQVLNILYTESRPSFYAARLACKQWAYQGAKIYSANNQLSTTGWKRCLKEDELGILKLTKLTKNSAHPLVTKFVLNPYVFKQFNIQMYHKIMSMGRHITFLNLRFGVVSDVAFRKRSFTIQPLPDLKHLKFECEWKFSTPDVSCVLETILQGAINLRIIELITCGTRETSLDFRNSHYVNRRLGNLTVQKRLKYVLLKKLPVSVKNLSIDIGLTNEDLVFLMDTGFKLNQINFTYPFSSVVSIKEEVIQRFLNTQAKHMADLCFENVVLCHEPTPSKKFVIPCFPNLHALTIGFPDQTFIANGILFSFLDVFPNLVKLDLKTANRSLLTALLNDPKGNKSYSLKSLRLPIFVASRSPMRGEERAFEITKLIDNIIESFPNLNSIGLNYVGAFRRKLISSIFSKMEYTLEHMQVHIGNEKNEEDYLDSGLRLLDSPFIGISTQECIELKRTRQTLKTRRQKLSFYKKVDLSRFVMTTPIYNLKNLKTLAIIAASDFQSVSISTIGVQMAILKIPNLSELFVECAFDGVNRSAMNQLKRKLKLLVIPKWNIPSPHNLTDDSSTEYESYDDEDHLIVDDASIYQSESMRLLTDEHRNYPHQCCIM